ncbi:hypothetical protein [Pedobacter sandarakinus]|uniref:hypothetical protein n=1 Tax=Pedobacter sandarakinus TaxID=353156 RepID=UPI0022461DCC|nr:hypothetical protein [Pedobacter sandarakinus]MCX2573612.1 hypothetical protein [Pedobacter sandarakinus]
MRNGKFNRGWKFIFFLPIAALVVALLGYVVMFLWNYILPEVAHTGKLTFWQGLGLLALCRLLFGNFGKGGGGFKNRASAMRNKWQNMNDEERARFKEEYKRRCGGWGHRNKA